MIRTFVRIMPAAPTVTTRRPNPKVPAPVPDKRFDKRLTEILEHATAVFYDKGYEGASMRDLSRASGKSLAGLYYYFESKEKLLYLIQRHTFRTVIDTLNERLRGVTDPEQRVRVFIQNHLEYFLANMKAMKVLSHEADVLKNGYGEEIQGIKREYYRIAFELLDALRAAGSHSSPAQRSRGVNASSTKSAAVARRNPSGRPSASSEETRLAVLSLFGMLNWIYTWHNPQVDGDAAKLSERMANTFLNGVFSASHASRSGSPKS